MLSHYASFAPTKLPLAQLIRFGVHPDTPQLYRSSRFLLDELPVRLARRIVLMRNPPKELAMVRPFAELADVYEDTFNEVVEFNKNHSLHEALNKYMLGEASAVPREEPMDSEPAPPPTVLGSLASMISRPEPYVVCPGADSRPVKLYYAPKLVKTLASQAGEFPPEVHKFNDACSAFFGTLLSRHSNDLVGLFRSVNRELFEMKVARPVKYATRPPIDHCAATHAWLDSIHLLRILTRFLLSQHQSLFKVAHGQVPRSHLKELQRNGNVGVIATNVTLYDVINDAVLQAENTVVSWTGMQPPEILLTCDEEARCVCVPAHLWHIFFELVKNAIRATMEHSGGHVFNENGEAVGLRAEARKECPPIEILVTAGTTDYLVKIKDLGGGIAPSQLQNISSYFYTTVPKLEILSLPVDSIAIPNSGNEHINLLQNANESQAAGKAAPLAGLGYGLPLSKLYARYFGGELDLVSLHGYGTEAFIRVNRFGTGCEQLG